MYDESHWFMPWPAMVYSSRYAPVCQSWPWALVFGMLQKCTDVWTLRGQAHVVLMWKYLHSSAWWEIEIGCTPPNKLFKGKYVNLRSGNRNFEPTMTIFWKFSVHLSINPIFFHLKNCWFFLTISIWIFKIQAWQQQYHCFSGRECLLSTFNLTQKLCTYMLYED